MKQKLALPVLTLTAALFLSAAPAALADGYGTLPYGQVNCQPGYGNANCTPQTVLINKLVQNPQSGAFVNNLGVNDPKYNPGQNVTFHLEVSNPSVNDLQNVTVTDTLPQYISFVSGPGSFDSGSNKLTFTIADLPAGQNQEFTVVAKTADSNNLPSNQGVTCVTNQANASAAGAQSSATSQFCITNNVLNASTKGGLPVYPTPNVTKTPPTGPEALPLLGLLSSGIFGALLRRRSK